MWQCYLMLLFPLCLQNPRFWEGSSPDGFPPCERSGGINCFQFVFAGVHARRHAYFGVFISGQQQKANRCVLNSKIDAHL